MFLLKKLKFFVLLLLVYGQLSVSLANNLSFTAINAFGVSEKAYTTAHQKGITVSNTYIYVDFTLPSTSKRLYVVVNHRVVFSTYVSHGIGSGRGSYVKTVSNAPNSLQSSVGVSQVLSYYQGKNGLSAKLRGLEPAYNGNMLTRSIVIHGANYIGDGKTGHSFGCFAVPFKDLKTILSYARPGTIIVAYFPDSSWLQNSKFLRG